MTGLHQFVCLGLWSAGRRGIVWGGAGSRGVERGAHACRSSAESIRLLSRDMGLATMTKKGVKNPGLQFDAARVSRSCNNLPVALPCDVYTITALPSSTV
jgi:hypothetical protein